MEKAGIIIKRTEPTDWDNSLLIVKKCNGTLLLYLDPKDLNTVIKREHFAIPSADDIMLQLHGNASSLSLTCEMVSGIFSYMSRALGYVYSTVYMEDTPSLDFHLELRQHQKCSWKNEKDLRWIKHVSCSLICCCTCKNRYSLAGEETCVTWHSRSRLFQMRCPTCTRQQRLPSNWQEMYKVRQNTG